MALCYGLNSVRVLPWLSSVRADAVFGWRQLNKRKITSAAAILSLALAMGASISAFRLIDALLLRPLPVSDPARLYVIAYEGTDEHGKPDTWDSCSYPMFRTLRAVAGNRAELIAISYAERVDLTFGSDQEIEKTYRQNVSGWMFQSFGLKPALGRLLTEKDDLIPGAHPYAVLSYDYWTRRFGRDPQVVGRTFHMDNRVYQIVGVVARGFTGTEPGTFTSIFVPTMMEAGSIDRANAFWLRTFVRLKRGVAPEPLRDSMYAAYRAFEQQRAKGFTNFPKHLLEGYPREKMVLKSAAAGVSGLQQNYRRALAALAVLIALVLLIACGNVANLLTAQAASRAREMALRVSIGAGRGRLVQLVLIESSLLAFCAAGAGCLFGWRLAPFVAGMINPPDNPVRLVLPGDWRVVLFCAALTLAVTLLFGLPAALRASAIQPAGALRGSRDPHTRHRLMLALIAVQVAFCFIVHFAAGLFVASFDHLANRPTGFSADRLLTLETDASPRQAPVFWEQVAAHLRSVPGVDTVALAGWPLMSGTMSNNFISINGAPPSDVLAFFLHVSPGWMETMKIPFLAGRDLRAPDADTGAAIVNQAFARQYFRGENPIGHSFETTWPARTRFQIVGLVRDASYRSLREAMLPVVYVPFDARPMGTATYVVRTAGANPLALVSILRSEVPRARSEFRVSNIRTQKEIDDAQTVRERLLARLALFFAVVALLLAGIGLYGVLNYFVVERRREIGIRIAIGAPAADIVRRVTTETLGTVLVGVAGGAALGLMSAPYIEALLFQVNPTGAPATALPALMMTAVALLAALPAVVRAVHIDPATMLRED